MRSAQTAAAVPRTITQRTVAAAEPLMRCRCWLARRTRCSIYECARPIRVDRNEHDVSRTRLHIYGTHWNSTGTRRNRRRARHRPRDAGAWAASHTSGHQRHQVRDDRSLPRSSRYVCVGAHAGIALPVPPILAAAQPLPLIRHCCGAAATVDERRRRHSERRPVCRRLPMLCIASSAASPSRRTCGRSAAPLLRLARVTNRASGAQRPCRGGSGVAG